MSSAVRALVIGHADFAVGIVSAVQQITGNGSALMPLTNANLGAAAIEELVRNSLASTGAQIVFTDLPAGSAAMAVRKIQRSMPELIVVAGANLALLLEFVQQLSDRDIDAARRALDRGKAAMMLLGGQGVD